METGTRILIADDHVMFRQVLKAHIEAQGWGTVVAEASDGLQAVELAASERPDVVLMDLWMPRLSGIEATSRIAEQKLAKVLVVSTSTDRQHIRAVLRAGATGYVSKHSKIEELARAVKAVAEGNSYLCADAAEYVVHSLDKSSDPGDIDNLSHREREVLQLVADGMSSKEIAALLDISVATVHNHRNNLMDKLGAHKASSLVRVAIRRGLIEP